ncbi:CAMK/CAMKL/KIN1 protein kinase [Paracoccidioides lutzii Pb01]|uniref:non-specific serine/threonine protein kinase n=1 Tax=Paracoccidioides lutzii (strain ATCC MYA-826 / Pb01) TaxID=502779 RepID=A0A0A2V5C2_PARBA|nr:CAMK/CAMKL/KIN1 protein kinase [Paracoccidioides lutzii Pb01]KGQ01552.1 CAMK/CAMKL/KIN1 protein kinase [Paracoccidioides lutzii Pb01]
MSAAASGTAPVIVRSHSTSRSNSSYRTTPTDLPHRARSTAVRPSQSTHSHHRSNSRPLSYDRPSTSNPVNPADAPHRDYETSNVARPPTFRRSLSRDRSKDTTHQYRVKPSHSHHRTLSRPTQGLDSVDMAGPMNPVNPVNTANPVNPGPAVADDQSFANGTHQRPPNGISNSVSQPKRRTTITTVSGQWALGKTIGAGSMGKVKLAKNLETGEQVAVKIIPRHSTEEHRGNRDAERADRSKEIRTAREAAIVTLLNHPYVCGMRDVVRTNYHWYMLFEYVNGGQMLDYIISHGKLKEKQARKFARQIASALDYCHKNSIVHRDLKIENILISKTGDIKIIDFGLSNLYSPKSQLKTFCGSLYFAAPELLQARQYIGPEVDVWSFGIVLYVLVCGKVPFDDQSMPQLHAKIKKGVVEYPQGLSSDCRHIISRMLVTDPKQRASLNEIINHPWMTKGFSGSPENFLPHREPLQLPLDPDIVQRMTGFDFGPPEFITAQLTKVLESEDYQNIVRLSQREHPTPHLANNEKKRGVFDFYKRRNSASKDTLSSPSAEVVHPANDLNGYNPLISIYQLVREKRDRERQEECLGALAIPHSPCEPALQIPKIPAPEAAHTNQNAYEIPGDKETGGRSRPRARTHGDDEVRDGIKNIHLGPAAAAASPSIVTPPVEQDPVSAYSRQKKLLLEKVFSVRRPKHEIPSPATLHSGGSQPQQPDFLRAPRSGDPPPRTKNVLGRSASVNSGDNRVLRNGRRGFFDGLVSPLSQDPPLTSGSDRSSLNVQKSRQQQSDHAATQDSKSTIRTQTFRTKSLGHARRETRTHGDDEVRDGIKNIHLGPAAAAASPSIVTPPVEQVKKESAAVGLLRRLSTRRTREKPRDTDREKSATSQGPSFSIQPPEEVTTGKSFSVRRPKHEIPSPATLHSGGSQPQQPDFLRAPPVWGPTSQDEECSWADPPLTSGSDRSSLNVQKSRQQQSDHAATQDSKSTIRTQTFRTKSLGHARRESIQARRARREETREANVPEETDADLSNTGNTMENVNTGEDFSKPVFLKGLFSVSTTSSKPLPFIRADISRVLKQLGVEFTEIKGGFSCRHAPSIDLNRVVDVSPPSPDRQGMVSSHRRRISFGGLLSHEKDENRDEHKYSHSTRTPRRHQGSPDRSFISNSDGSDEYMAARDNVGGERVVGETTTRVQSDTGGNLVLKFEILIVKVPLFSLHGIQFKKVSGGMWQYREMAKKILDALKL